jgi:hypothetical protein
MPLFPEGMMIFEGKIIAHQELVQSGEYGAALIRAERLRQISHEYYDAKHDDGHDGAELARAAMCYAEAASILAAGGTLRQVQRAPRIARIWPFDRAEWKPGDDARRALEKAGALIAAEIDRLERKRMSSVPFVNDGA